MDPLSLAASIIAVVEVSHALLLCCYRLKGKVQGADGEIARVINEVEDVSAILSDLEPIVTSMAEDDTLYDGPWPPPWQPSIAACAAILVEISEKIEPFSRPGFRSKMKWTLESKNVDAKLAMLEKSKSTLQLALAALQTRITSQVRSHVIRVQDTLDGVGTAILHSESRVVESVDRLRDQARRTSVLNWLKTSDPEQNHKVSRDKHEPETADWIFHNKAYQAWESKDSEERTIPGGSATRVAYYYFDFSDNKKQTVVGLLQSVIYQLIVCNGESISEATLGLFQRHADGAEQPTLDELVELLRIELSHKEATYLVIDALDECPIDQRDFFFDTVLAGPLPPNLHLLVTSRRERDIEEALADAFSNTVCIQDADVDADVRTHVSKAILRDRTLKKWKPAIQQEILEAIVEGSRGMFRWAVCQLDTLKKCLTPAMVRAELKRMPKTLHQTYDRILLGIDELHQPFVRSALRWLAFSMRPLTLEELSEAAVVDPAETTFEPELVRLNDDTKILELCGTLVTSSKLDYDFYSTDSWLNEKVQLEKGIVASSYKETTAVSLSHYSVKEYIQSQQVLDAALASYHISSSLANTYLASSCLLYLVSYNSGQLHREKQFDEYPLLAYSARHWIGHWKLSQREDETSHLRRLFRRFFDPERTAPYSNWLSIWNPDFVETGHRDGIAYSRDVRRTVEHNVQPLYRAAALGDCSLVRDLVAKGNDPAAPEGYFESPMNAAAFNGHLDIVDFFLESGISPDLAGTRFACVLHAAAAGGSVAVVERLIAAGADVNTKGGEFNSALVAAASKEHDEVVACLLRHGADVNTTSRAHGSGLYQAAKAGDQKTVLMFLAAGADVNGRGGDPEGPPLYGAAESGSVTLIQTLLRRGADVNKGSDLADFGYPVAVAAVNKQLSAVRALLRAGAEVNVPPRGHRGVSVLEAAIESRDMPTFLAVLDAGADPNVQGNLYMNAFHAAIFTGEMDMARVLLERGAEVEDEGFLEAVERYQDHPWFLNEILRTRDPDINACRQNSNSSVMHTAIQSAGTEVARLLFERGPYLDAVSDDGTILDAAIRRGMTDLAKDMIKLGVDTNFFVKDSPAFAQAARRACDDGDFELMDSMLRRGADTSDAVMTIVSSACYGDEPTDEYYAQLDTILRYLVRNGAGLDTVSKSWNKCSPLQLAVQRNQPRLVRMLLNAGADINGPPGEDGFVLHYALYSRERSMVEFLLASGARVDDSLQGCSLLVKAIRMGLVDMVPLLLEKGARLNETENGQSPLATAYHRRHKDLAKFLFGRGARFSRTDARLLQLTLSHQRMEELKELLEYGLDPNTYGDYIFPLEDAAKSGRIDMVTFLRENGADFRHPVPGSPGPLTAAAGENDLDMVTWLLDAGADPNYRCGTYRHPLYNAVTKGLELVDLLLRRGATITPDVWEASVWGGEAVVSRLLEESSQLPERECNLNYALQSAAHAAKHSLCLWLLSKGANMSAGIGRWGSPLQAALANESIYQAAEINNRILIIETLISRGADVNAPAYTNSRGTTYGPPLLLAIALRASKLVGMLLAAGADVNHTGGVFHSPLQAAARLCSPMVPELLRRGARVNVIGGKIFGSALHAAAFAHDEETVELLLRHGADAHAMAGKYGSVLQAAAKWDSVSTGSWTAGRKSVRVMKLLLEGGADVNAQGGKYGSALQMAAKSGNLDGIKWLLANGADIHARGGKWGSAKEAALKKKRWNVVSYLWRIYGKD